MALDKDEKRYLLELAKKTIRTVLDGKKIGDIEVNEEKIFGRLSEKRGVFVTINKNRELRGCIGYIFPMLPLWQAVVENARNAAFRDPRFTPLSPSEFDAVEIEISVLTEPARIDDISGFVLGKDGIILKKGSRQAVFLPQVAPEQGWDVETTMAHLSMKAGLSPDDWKNGSVLETFQAEVFSESGA